MSEPEARVPEDWGKAKGACRRSDGPVLPGVIVYKMGEVRRAARWPSAQGCIVRSGLRTVDSKTAGGTRGRGNVPDVRYVFSVDGVQSGRSDGKTSTP